MVGIYVYLCGIQMEKINKMAVGGNAAGWWGRKGDEAETGMATRLWYQSPRMRQLLFVEKS